MPAWLVWTFVNFWMGTSRPSGGTPESHSSNQDPGPCANSERPNTARSTEKTAARRSDVMRVAIRYTSTEVVTPVITLKIAKQVGGVSRRRLAAPAISACRAQAYRRGSPARSGSLGGSSPAISRYTTLVWTKPWNE
jgi:hypothetical protein